MEGGRLNQRRGVAGSNAFIAVTGGLVITGAVALGLVRFFGGTPELERNPEGAVAAVALASVVAAPGVLALMALRGRPVLLLPAGTMLVPLSFLSLAGATLPLLVPAVMLFVAYGRRSGLSPPRRGQAAITTVVTVALLIEAGLALFVHQDPRTYSTPTSGGGVSDVITYAESGIALAVVGAAMGWAWLASAPGNRRGRDSPGSIASSYSGGCSGSADMSASGYTWNREKL